MPVFDRATIAAALPDHALGPEIGQGSFGAVLAARHRGLGRDHAVKVLVDSDGHGEQTFRREAEAAANLDHMHVVHIHDYKFFEGLGLIVMERLTGGSLRDRIRAGTTSPAQACVIALATAGALHAAHGKRHIHRDVKPTNILFTDDGCLRVTDFGIAKWIDGTGAVASRTVGTPGYMAPEQFGVGELQPASDVYALAVVLYELLAGSPPFAPAERSLHSFMRHHLYTRPPRPEGVADPLVDVLMRALAKDPRDRHPSARAFALDLAAAAARSLPTGWLLDAGMPLFVDEDVRETAGGRTTGRPATSGPKSWAPPTTPLARPSTEQLRVVPPGDNEPDLPRPADGPRRASELAAAHAVLDDRLPAPPTTVEQDEDPSQDLLVPRQQAIGEVSAQPVPHGAARPAASRPATGQIDTDYDTDDYDTDDYDSAADTDTDTDSGADTDSAKIGYEAGDPTRPEPTARRPRRGLGIDVIGIDVAPAAAPGQTPESRPEPQPVLMPDPVSRLGAPESPDRESRPDPASLRSVKTPAAAGSPTRRDPPRPRRSRGGFSTTTGQPGGLSNRDTRGTSGVPESTDEPRTVKAPRAKTRDTVPGERLVLPATVMFVLLLIAAAMAFGAIRDDYFVGDHDGQVTIFRGVDADIAGVPLNVVEESRALRVDDLPEPLRSEVRDGVDKTSLDEARAYVANLSVGS